MLNTIFFAVILFFPCISVAAQEIAPLQVLPGPIPARFVRVVDGDTFIVRAQIWLRQEVEVSVRIRGIDAPELKGKCEKERAQALDAKRHLEELLTLEKGGGLLLEQVAADKYGGRVVARVVRRLAHGRDIDIGEYLLQEGIVLPYDGTARRPWCP